MTVYTCNYEQRETTRQMRNISIFAHLHVRVPGKSCPKPSKIWYDLQVWYSPEQNIGLLVETNAGLVLLRPCKSSQAILLSYLSMPVPEPMSSTLRQPEATALCIACLKALFLLSSFSIRKCQRSTRWHRMLSRFSWDTASPEFILIAFL